jgi:hypothetical protein
MKNYPIKAHVESISPAIAAKILKDNTNNRNLSDKLVEHYASQMKKGRWQVNGEAIVIAGNGVLMDGQHRLSAVIHSGVVVDMLVVRGVENKAMNTIDIGKGRSIADHLRMQGHEGPLQIITAAVQICARFKGNVYTESKMRLVPLDVINYLERNRMLAKSAEWVSMHKEIQALVPASVACAMHFLFYQVSPTDCEVFFHKLATGEDLHTKSPILKLRSQLISMRADQKRGGFNRRMYLYYLCHTFKNVLDRKDVEQGPRYQADYTIEIPTQRRK